MRNTIFQGWQQPKINAPNFMQKFRPAKAMPWNDGFLLFHSNPFCRKKTARTGKCRRLVVFFLFSFFALFFVCRCTVDDRMIPGIFQLLTHNRHFSTPHNNNGSLNTSIGLPDFTHHTLYHYHLNSCTTFYSTTSKIKDHYADDDW